MAPVNALAVTGVASPQEAFRHASVSGRFKSRPHWHASHFSN